MPPGTDEEASEENIDEVVASEHQIPIEPDSDAALEGLWLFHYYYGQALGYYGGSKYAVALARLDLAEMSLQPTLDLWGEVTYVDDIESLRESIEHSQQRQRRRDRVFIKVLWTLWWLWVLYCLWEFFTL